MNRTILYYPTIDIPRSSWLKHALLYWDEVSSIIPATYDDRFLYDLSPDIQYLIGEEQFRPIQPETLISGENNWEKFQEFQDEFQATVLNPNFERFRNRNQYSRHNHRIHQSKVEQKRGRIHRNKTSDGLFYFLEDLGLATRDENDEWLKFEHNTALLYMSLLAKYLAEVDNEQTTIGTDFIAYEKFNFKTTRKNSGFPVVSFDLNNILPTPKENVSLEQIVDFKRRRADNLRHFKRTISDFQTEISNAKSNAELKESAINFQEDLINGVQDLTALLKDSNIESSLKTFKSLIDIKSPTLWTSAGTVLNSHLDFVHLPLNLTTIGISAMAALELSTKYIETRNKRMAETRQSPFSYLYYARKSGIISRRW
ncbi:DUF6236 family protein [Maribacter sp. CXY002]|uniref:DUF6236 family protein n=1 Tax=Maribacter luteocoastalis TaxID=3407671 RepID=UPI003B6746DD